MSKYQYYVVTEEDGIYGTDSWTDVVEAIEQDGVCVIDTADGTVIDAHSGATPVDQYTGDDGEDDEGEEDEG